MEQGDRQTAAIDAAMKARREGDCIVGLHPFVHKFNSIDPATPETRAIQDGSVDLIEVETDGLVLVSQSCDIVRTCVDRPFVSVSPLVVRDDLDAIRKGRKPQFAFIPALADRKLVADLDRVMTVEKGLVASWQLTRGCRTDEEARMLSAALGRKFSRVAFPDDFVKHATKLVDRLVKKHDKQTPEGSALQALREIRVWASPSWESPAVEIHFFFIREEDQLSFQGTNWAQFLDMWLALIPVGGRFSKITGEVSALEDLTGRDYSGSDPLDLDHLSGP